MAKKINNNAIVIWQTLSEGVGEPALLIRQYMDNMIGIQQEDKEEVLINEETFPLIIKIMKHLMSHTSFEHLKL
jgi:hypothetical protein